jgi:hypothetical protein
MSNDLVTEITGRVERLLDGLLTTLVLRRLPTLPPLGQRLYTRYSDWASRLFSRLHSPLNSALLLSQSSNLWLLPLSYAWFDKRWIDRKKESRSFRNQSDNRKDESIQRLSVPEYLFEEDAEEGLIKQFQSTQSEPADDIILSIPTLMNLAAGNTGFTRPEQLAKKIALRLELLTNKGSPTPWHMPFEASGVPYHPGMVTNDSLLDKGNEIIASQHLSHLEETFYPSSPVDLSPLSLHPVSGQYIGTMLMPVPGKFSLAERTPTQAVSPFVPSYGGINFDFEQSGALPAALNSQPASEARIVSLSHLSGPTSMTSNNIPARKVFSRLQSPFITPLVTSSTNMMGKALTASPSYLFKSPQVESGAVLGGEAGTTPASYPEELTLFCCEETPDMDNVASWYFQRLAPRPPLDKTWGSRQTSPLHWSAGHVPPSLTEKALSQEMGEPAEAIASTIKNSSFGGYNRSMGVELALAPIGRQRENISPATSSAVNTGQEGALEAVGEPMPAPDPEALASEVYSILKHRLIVEKERTTSVV